MDPWPNLHVISLSWKVPHSLIFVFIHSFLPINPLNFSNLKHEDRLR